MALQRINRVRIRDLRSWRGDHEFTFDEAVMVVYGPKFERVHCGRLLCLAFFTKHVALWQEKLDQSEGGAGNIRGD